MPRPSKTIRNRLKLLEQHLQEENPLLVDVVDGFRKLSKVGYATGLLSTDESYATQIPWWPLISVLGTFSAGKSTFINHHLGYPLQDTGNQAVDDKFTVTCYSNDKVARVLPGLALDADPRFPFYQTSEELDKVAPGEGRRIDSYLQLKTCKCDNLLGKIIIDSPGFDADSQRSATLRLTNHIIDLSDLVLVFFDARHPEPGAMSDTLAHLVRKTIDRSDSSKFLYILNQIDTSAREDNPEEVVGAWQRALAKEGLTAGRFYCIYNPDAANPIEDQAKRRRFEWKRDQDMSDIMDRIDHVSVERSYRIIGALDKHINEIEETHIPRIRSILEEWRKKTLIADGVILASIVLFITGLYFAFPKQISSMLSATQELFTTPGSIAAVAGGITALLVGIHFYARNFSAKRIIEKLQKDTPAEESKSMVRAFQRNTRFWRSVFDVDPVGWNRRNKRLLKRLKDEAGQYVQQLNDRFTDPSGSNHKKPDSKPDNNSEEKVEKDAPILTGEIITESRFR